MYKTAKRFIAAAAAASVMLNCRLSASAIYELSAAIPPEGISGYENISSIAPIQYDFGVISDTVEPLRYDSYYLSSGTESNNASANNYTVWGKVVNSYFFENSDGTFTRAEYLPDKGIVVEVYLSDFTLLKSMVLPMELPRFGGIYSGKDYNFVVFGQNNPTYSEDVEVARVVKFSKDWERLEQCSTFGSNCSDIFGAGSLRMTEYGGKLYIHTCHGMYPSPGDGKCHQANLTFVIDEATMERERFFYKVEAGIGYCSHSFNQFVRVEDGYVYLVDHGDAYPRYVAVSKSTVGTDGFTRTSALDIQGTIGDNKTGVSVGGFELSAGNCIIAGNTVDQSSGSAEGQRNIFLSVVSKDMSSARIVQLTSYAEESGIAPRTPHLVKLGSDRFIVMWEEYDSNAENTSVKIVAVNGSGEPVSDIVSADLRLSDCQPIVTKSGLIMWYITMNTNPCVLKVDPENLSNTDSFGAEWSLDASGTLRISGYGAVKGRPWESRLSEIKAVVIEDGVTAINEKAFSGCENLESVSIADTVKHIGTDAFAYCTKLKNIVIPKSLSDTVRGICYSDRNLEKAEINGTGGVGQYAFMNCVSLKEAVIGNGVPSIGDNSFSYCALLESVTIPESVTAIADNAFVSSPNVTIRGYVGSYAETFAREKNIPFESMGTVSEDESAAFIERLYVNMLGRPSDEEGKANHAANLKNGESACKIAYDFVFSKEFLEMPISSEERARRMYLTFLDREPDAAGLADWTETLDSGCSVGHLFYGFTQSNEFAKICSSYNIRQGSYSVSENRDKSSKLTAFVSRLYTKAMGRSYDVNGLNDHTGSYLENRDLYQLAYNFIFSSEFIGKNLSDEDFVDVMYQTFFDREADPAGKADWLGRLKSGCSREDVLAGFVGSQECSELVARFGI